MEAADDGRRPGAVRADEEVVPAADVRKLQEGVRELERRLGRKTLEV